MPSQHRMDQLIEICDQAARDESAEYVLAATLTGAADEAGITPDGAYFETRCNQRKIFTGRNYITCPECRGKGSTEREVRSRTMNSGGFAYIDVECSRCEGNGEIEVDDPFTSSELKSLSEIESELSAEMEDAA
jgi:DnaJ-class molecular chaperone